MSTNGDQPRGARVFAAGMDAAAAALQGGDEFWPDVERLTGGDLAGRLDDALAGTAAPRIWLFAHEPGQPQLGVVAALTMARALGARDQATLVLDGDDRTTVLTRWSGREDAEGWIDMVRYGTSLLTSGVTLPFAGRTAYLLGVGSYAPTDVTGEEVQQLLGRLRRQADDVLIVCPVTTAALWAGHADLALVCVDRQARSTAHIDELAAELEGAGARPCAVVGFGDAPIVTAPEPEPDVAAPVAPPEEPAGQPVPGDEDGPEDEEPVDDGMGDVEAALAALEERTADDPADSFDVEATTRRGSSGVFWLAAAVSVVLIAVVGVYYFKYVRVADDGFETSPPAVAVGPGAEPATGDGSTAAEPGDAPRETGGESEASADPTVTGVVGTGPDGAAGEGREATSDEPGTPGAEDPAASGPEDTAAAGGHPPATGEERTEDGDGTDPATEPAGGTPPPTAADGDTGPRAPADPAVDPFTRPVGRDGWAMWVYSMPDSASAARQMAVLDRKGIIATVRIVEIAGKGRWHRIYMGNFADRASAQAAKAGLLVRLRTDWAQPVRFYASADD